MSADSPRRSVKGGGSVVRPQPVSDKSVMESVVGFFQDVTYSTQKPDDKEKVQWVRFEQCDLNDVNNNPDIQSHTGIVPPLLLIIGYTNGVQIWSVPASGEAQELVSLRQGPVKHLRLLPHPQPVFGRSDSFASKRPLMALCDASSAGQPFCSVKLLSLKTGDEVHNIAFNHPVVDIKCNDKVIVVAFADRIAAFDSCQFKQRFYITSCYPAPRPNINPIALGTTWLAYADKQLVPVHQSCGGMTGDGNVSYTATVISAAKTITKGLTRFGESVASTLSTKPGPGPVKKETQNPAGCRPGIVTIVDIMAVNEGQFSVQEEYTCEGLVGHFMAHQGEPLTAMTLDPTGTILVTTDRQGHNFHVFKIMNHPSSSSLGAVHHLYTLYRGDTTAKVQDMSFTLDSRWIAISTIRGTTHVFPITTYGGPINVRTHTSQRVVNRASRYHRSAGLDDMVQSRPSSGRESPKPSPGGASGSPGSSPGRSELYRNMFHHNAINNSMGNPRLPPFPHPTTLPPLVQIRQSLAIPGLGGSGPVGGTAKSTSKPGTMESICVAACFARSRGWVAGSPNVSRDKAEDKKAVDSLYILTGHGTLVEYILDPHVKSGIDKDKVTDDSPIEVFEVPRAQWNLCRSCKSPELKPPLAYNNMLILSAESVLSQKPSGDVLLQQGLVTRQESKESLSSDHSSTCDQDDLWLSQVEIITHTGPHRRLWMGPQFSFKTFQGSSTTTVLPTQSAVLLSRNPDVHMSAMDEELDLQSLTITPARSSPVAMPGSQERRGRNYSGSDGSGNLCIEAESRTETTKPPANTNVLSSHRTSIAIVKDESTKPGTSSVDGSDVISVPGSGIIKRPLEHPSVIEHPEQEKLQPNRNMLAYTTRKQEQLKVEQNIQAAMIEVDWSEEPEKEEVEHIYTPPTASPRVESPICYSDLSREMDISTASGCSGVSTGSRSVQVGTDDFVALDDISKPSIVVAKTGASKTGFDDPKNSVSDSSKDVHSSNSNGNASLKGAKPSVPETTLEKSESVKTKSANHSVKSTEKSGTASKKTQDTKDKDTKKEEKEQKEPDISVFTHPAVKVDQAIVIEAPKSKKNGKKKKGKREKTPEVVEPEVKKEEKDTECIVPKKDSVKDSEKLADKPESSNLDKTSGPKKSDKAEDSGSSNVKGSSAVKTDAGLSVWRKPATKVEATQIEEVKTSKEETVPSSTESKKTSGKDVKIDSKKNEDKSESKVETKKVKIEPKEGGTKKENPWGKPATTIEPVKSEDDESDFISLAPAWQLDKKKSQSKVAENKSKSGCSKETKGDAISIKEAAGETKKGVIKKESKSVNPWGTPPTKSEPEKPKTQTETKKETLTKEKSSTPVEPKKNETPTWPVENKSSKKGLNDKSKDGSQSKEKQQTPAKQSDKSKERSQSKEKETLASKPATAPVSSDTKVPEVRRRDMSPRSQIAAAQKTVTDDSKQSTKKKADDAKTSGKSTTRTVRSPSPARDGKPEESPRDQIEKLVPLLEGPETAVPYRKSAWANIPKKAVEVPPSVPTSNDNVRNQPRETSRERENSPDVFRTQPSKSKKKGKKKKATTILSFGGIPGAQKSEEYIPPLNKDNDDEDFDHIDEPLKAGLEDFAMESSVEDPISLHLTGDSDPPVHLSQDNEPPISLNLSEDNDPPVGIVHHEHLEEFHLKESIDEDYNLKSVDEYAHRPGGAECIEPVAQNVCIDLLSFDNSQDNEFNDDIDVIKEPENSFEIEEDYFSRKADEDDYSSKQLVDADTDEFIEADAGPSQDDIDKAWGLHEDPLMFQSAEGIPLGVGGSNIEEPSPIDDIIREEEPAMSALKLEPLTKVTDVPKLESIKRGTKSSGAKPKLDIAGTVNTDSDANKSSTDSSPQEEAAASIPESMSQSISQSMRAGASDSQPKSFASGASKSKSKNKKKKKKK